MNFNHEMLTLAREIRGITQNELAQKTGISQARISRYEGGIKDVSEEDLTLISELLKFPATLFMRDGKRYGADTGELFHRRRKSVSKKQLNMIDGHLNKRRLEVTDLLKQLDSISPYEIPILSAYNYDDPAEIASIVRSKWQIPSGPIHNLVRQLEAASCVIFTFDFGTDKIDEAVQWIEPSSPIILINNRSPWDRVRFSLAHALGHLIMHRGEFDAETMEAEADAFAAAFLMPEDDIRDDLQAVTLDNMLSVKPYWKVSAQALIRRARDIDQISEKRYTSLNQMISRAGYRKNEPVKLPPENVQLVQSLRNVYMEQLDYSIEEFAELVQLNVDECRMWYQINAPYLNIIVNKSKQRKSS